jgi:integrase
MILTRRASAQLLFLGSFGDLDSIYHNVRRIEPVDTRSKLAETKAVRQRIYADKTCRRAQGLAESALASCSLDHLDTTRNRQRLARWEFRSLSILLPTPLKGSWTGVRRSDVVLLGKQHVRDGWLKFTQQKNRNRKPVTIEIPILADLQHIIDASPTGDLTFIVSQRGRPFAVSAFGNWFRTRCDEAGLPQCSAHGLRKAGATIAAENGATTSSWRFSGGRHPRKRNGTRRRPSARRWRVTGCHCW